ncbi:hypothetical protein FACS1894181_11570 [Bacteroidia bacterium]|nr:hypothetical protein FACS1894181_11570 [Bacteroidia bacterium]
MQVSERYYDEVFEFKGTWDMPSKCGLKILEKAGRKVIIVTELYQGNPGTSVTYAGESLALQICEAKNLDFGSVRYIECNPDMNSKLSFYDEEYYEVTFGGSPGLNYRLLSKKEMQELFSVENKITIGMRNPKFDDLRPYYDEEIPSAMRRISESEHFPSLAAYVYPGRDIDEVKSMICAYTSIDEFQFQVMKAASEQVIAQSIRRFSFDGFQELDKEQRYLFVSNHRDIMLDATLLQYALYLSGHRTSEISFGSNLMYPQLVVDIGKSNKMYKTIRGGNMKDFYNNSQHLSNYIRHTLLEKRESVWIAQSNGRTKNGLDTTEPGIIKMFYMSNPGKPAKALGELNIVPISISYQWETCGEMKAFELYCKQRDGQYIKKPDEDLNSILSGITQYKGDVHIHCGTPLAKHDLISLRHLPNNVINKKAASLIDRQVRRNYKLSCNNYIAHDLLSQAQQYTAHYTPEDKQAFLSHYGKAMAMEVEDKETFSDIFLRIYANPVDSKIQMQG